ncbi:MAG: YicC/YloC family endoribonuclease [Candidatus Binatia bacterium]
MKSMTGYGEGAAQILGSRVTVQLRSLNHRHLDLQLRTPREYLSFEEEFRKLIREKVSRGRIEAFIGRAPAKERTRKLELNEELLGEYVRTMRRAKRRFGLAGEVDVSLFSTFSELFQVREVEAAPNDERKGLFKAFRVALQKLEVSREREGRQLKGDVESQIRHLRKIAAALEKEAAQIGVRAQKGGAVPKDFNLEIKNSNAEDDVNNFVLKGDVNEEVVRVKSHIGALADVVQERDPVGKKIEFMLQEVQRELNTISSKVPYLPVTRLVLEGKERVEKIREQAQNIE